MTRPIHLMDNWNYSFPNVIHSQLLQINSRDSLSRRRKTCAGCMLKVESEITGVYCNRLMFCIIHNNQRLIPSFNMGTCNDCHAGCYAIMFSGKSPDHWPCSLLNSFMSWFIKIAKEFPLKRWVCIGMINQLFFGAIS